MNLASILKGISACTDLSALSERLLSTEIHSICNYAESVTAGDVYAAIRGTKKDGHQFIPAVVQKGAVAVIVDHDIGLENQIIVPDTREAWALMCADFFGNPARELKMIGVTGTNGKTSVSTMLKCVLEEAGIVTGLIGTIRAEYQGRTEETVTTTPDAFFLQRILRQMVSAGCQAVVMEVSSHGLSQRRLCGCQFDLGVFLNLSQDHLDYHKDMEHYYQAKKQLFSICNRAVVNLRDDYGRRLLQEIQIPKVTFSAVQPEADFSASEITCSREGVRFRVRCGERSERVFFAIPGFYSVENALAAIAAGCLLNVKLETILHALNGISGIRGRSEVLFHREELTVICDYAHTPDGILNVLASLRECAEHRLVVLFGCGGDRDREKRLLMAKACERYADFIIVTSDNPRTEEPQKIVEDILPGLSGKVPFTVILDREEAIRYSLMQSLPGDTVVLLGKGHETYQIIGKEKLPFDERKIVDEILNGKEKTY